MQIVDEPRCAQHLVRLDTRVGCDDRAKLLEHLVLGVRVAFGLQQFVDQPREVTDVMDTGGAIVGDVDPKVFFDVQDKFDDARGPW